MTAHVTRVRMFAGPNGSGKSTLFRHLLQPEWRGIYINPDEIEQSIRAHGFLDFETYEILGVEATVLDFFRQSSLVKKAKMEAAVTQLRMEDGRLYFAPGTANAYFASVASDFIRHRLLALGKSFTFETVMSSADKVEFLRKAQATGCRTYLYYVATDDPVINQSRVQFRVSEGGHSVPPEKIVSRYHASLRLLPDAIRAAHCAYIFDNSGENREHTWLAEITDGQSLKLQAEVVPSWFKKAVLDPLTT